MKGRSSGGNPATIGRSGVGRQPAKYTNHMPFIARPTADTCSCMSVFKLQHSKKQTMTINLYNLIPHPAAENRMMPHGDSVVVHVGSTVDPEAPAAGPV